MIAPKRILLAAVAALLACAAAACDSKGGGTSCFSPAVGPDGPSCSGFDEGLSCPVGVSPFYTCVCTGKTWVCTKAGVGMGGGGMGGGGMAGGGMGGGTTSSGSSASGTGGTGGH